MSCTFNEDDYRDNQLNKYLDDMENSTEVSNCCGAELLSESDICSACNEHAGIISLAEYSFEAEQDALADKADAERELKRDQDDF